MPDPTHDHAVRGRFHSWFLSATEDGMHRIYGERKTALFAALPQRVVEIGPGTGANFRYYRAGTQLIAVEPNRRMYDRLAANARRFGIEMEIRGLRGEALDLPDASADLVVCTLVLCSVDDPVAVVSEIRRVLRPGGRYVFLEHVGAAPGTVLRAVQNATTRPWRWLFEGCCPNRESWRVLESADFASLELQRFNVVTPFLHVMPQIAGIAVR